MSVKAGKGDQDRVKKSYDAVARRYHEELGTELDRKPFDRALLRALVEHVSSGTIADIGCGPGHVTRFLADLHDDVLGVDFSPRMLEVARAHYPSLAFLESDMRQLAVDDGSWAGAVAFYSIIHLAPDERAAAFAEVARCIRRDGWLLLAFHVDTVDEPAGTINHIDDFFGVPVDLDSYYLDPDTIRRGLKDAGFEIVASVTRRPYRSAEFPSRRCYLLCQRTGGGWAD